jgi:hypothetical protein
MLVPAPISDGIAPGASCHTVEAIAESVRIWISTSGPLRSGARWVEGGSLMPVRAAHGFRVPSLPSWVGLACIQYVATVVSALAATATSQALAMAAHVFIGQATRFQRAGTSVVDDPAALWWPVACLRSSVTCPQPRRQKSTTKIYLGWRCLAMLRSRVRIGLAQDRETCPGIAPERPDLTAVPPGRLKMRAGVSVRKNHPDSRGLHDDAT